MKRDRKSSPLKLICFSIDCMDLKSSRGIFKIPKGSAFNLDPKEIKKCVPRNVGFNRLRLTDNSVIFLVV